MLQLFRKRKPSLQVDVVPFGDQWLVRIVKRDRGSPDVVFLTTDYRKNDQERYGTTYSTFNSVNDACRFDQRKAAEVGAQWYREKFIHFEKLKDIK